MPANTLYSYICTNETEDPFVPAATPNITVLARDVSDAFYSLQGGHRLVGQISLFPVQRSVPGHLLCDGREVPKFSFPELFAFLGTTQGAAVDASNFRLPDFVGTALTTTATSAVETTTAGTASTPVPTDPALPPDFDKYGDIDSGGRFNDNPIP